MHDGVLLHVEPEQLVHAEFEELPDHADGHGEAEGHDRQIQGRKLELHPVGPVEQVDQREADRRSEEAVHRMQHRVPEREDLIERTDLAKNLSREHEHQHDDFQHRRQLDAELHLDERRRQQQQQRQDAQEHGLIVAVEELQHRDSDHQHAQHDIHRERAFVLPDLHAYGGFHGLPACAQRRFVLRFAHRSSLSATGCARWRAACRCSSSSWTYRGLRAWAAWKNALVNSRRMVLLEP